MLTKIQSGLFFFSFFLFWKIRPKIESFGWKLLNLKFICVIGIVLTYLGKWGGKVNFGNTVAEIQQKYEREREKVEERECMNFGNVITEIPATRSACPSVCAMCSKWDVLKKKNQLWQYHCQNRGRKKNLWKLWQYHYRNRGRKKNSDCRNLGSN